MSQETIRIYSGGMEFSADKKRLFLLLAIQSDQIALHVNPNIVGYSETKFYGNKGSSMEIEEQGPRGL